jgi:addiction module HigA family antidote
VSDPIIPGSASVARFDIRIVREQRGVSADTALRLGRYFATATEFWMDLQSDSASR